MIDYIFLKRCIGCLIALIIILIVTEVVVK